MSVGFYTTAVQGAGALNDMADCCLSPLRTLLLNQDSEQVYHYLGSWTAGGWGSSQVNHHYHVETVVSRLDLTVRRVFALIILTSLVPLVAGVVLKILAAYNGAKDAYAGIRNSLQQDRVVYLTCEGLRQVATRRVDSQDPCKQDYFRTLVQDLKEQHLEWIAQGMGMGLASEPFQVFRARYAAQLGIDKCHSPHSPKGLIEKARRSFANGVYADEIREQFLRSFTLDHLVSRIQEEFNRKFNFQRLRSREITEQEQGMIDYLAGLTSRPIKAQDKITTVKKMMFEPVSNPNSLRGYATAKTNEDKAAIELEARRKISREAVKAILCDIGLAEQRKVKA